METKRLHQRIGYQPVATDWFSAGCPGIPGMTRIRTPRYPAWVLLYRKLGTILNLYTPLVPESSYSFFRASYSYSLLYRLRAPLVSSHLFLCPRSTVTNRSGNAFVSSRRCHSNLPFVVV